MYPPTMELLRYSYLIKLRRFVPKYFKNINTNFAYNTSKLKDFFRYKDKLPNCMQAEIVCKFYIVNALPLMLA